MTTISIGGGGGGGGGVISTCGARHDKFMIGASLSEPHTSVTALLDTCVCLFVAIYRKFKLSKRVSNLHTC